jgi:hypothetical protein
VSRVCHNGFWLTQNLVLYDVKHLNLLCGS